MAGGFGTGCGSMLLVLALVLVVLPGKAAAFGAGNIPSIAQVEGITGDTEGGAVDIEDVLKTLAFLHGKKWTSMMVSRVYFGNWLRDYSQAVDVGSLKGVNAATIRILVWVLSFLANGYATEEFEVTDERLGVYRPEEHIDNPMGYADNLDARKFDPRLRGPVDTRELEVDQRTGMKNYIANEQGPWATSAGYLRFSFARSIHFGRVYTSGANGTSGKEADLCEALRCLGQALHCMEDFSAHSNYCELALIELGHREVFPHCGSSTQISLNNKRVYPLVQEPLVLLTFCIRSLGEATDHFTQSEVDEMNTALKNAEELSKNTSGNLGISSNRGIFGSSSGGGGTDIISLLSQLPGVGDGYAAQARNLKAASAAKEQENARAANSNIVPGMSPDFDPVKVVGQIYPILEFRDKIVRSISNMIARIPGLESLLEKISETLTAFVFGLLAPFVRPVINQVSKVLKDGSSNVISASAKSQLEPWTNPRCDNPTHSMLSKDHFTNILNSCAGRVAATVLQYVVPRVIFAWENPGVPVEEVVNDVLRAFHHPAIRDDRIQIQREMFETVRSWANESKYRNELGRVLSSESVRAGKNHILATGAGTGSRSIEGGGHSCDGGHGKPTGSLWSQIQTSREMSTSPAPAQAAQHRPLSSEYGVQPQPPSGYSGQVPPQNYGQGYPAQYQQPQQYNQPPQPGPGGYYQQPQQSPPQQYGGGGPGYGSPPQPQYQGYPGQQHHQQPPQQPPWDQYPRY